MLFLLLTQYLQLERVIILLILFHQWLQFLSDFEYFFIFNLLSLLNLILDSCLNIEFSRAFLSIDTLHLLDEVSEQLVHLVLVLDHEIHRSRGEDQGHALPVEEGERGFDARLLVVEQHYVVVH